MKYAVHKTLPSAVCRLAAIGLLVIAVTTPEAALAVSGPRESCFTACYQALTACQASARFSYARSSMKRLKAAYEKCNVTNRACRKQCEPLTND